jgi:predicted HTH transcriptional regulator
MYVKGKGKITIREYKELYPLLSDKTLSRDLSELVKKGVLKEIEDKKGKKYEL